MIVVMSTDATQGDVEKVQKHLTDKGLTGHVNPGTERKVIGVLGSIYTELEDEIKLMHGVSDVFRVSKPYKLASREFHPEDSVITIGKEGQVKIGGGHFCVFAGPCAVESEEQVMVTAKAVKAAGANVLRGGAFKPRTSPYSFRGLFEVGLKILAEASAATGLPVITEVMDTRDVELVSQYADVLQIGARNMQNYSLLDEAGKSDKPVMVKRGLSATYEDWLLSAEYVMAQGNKQVILTERGIRTFETYTRNTFDLNAIPSIHKLSHLPVAGDPSHSTGMWDLVGPVARGATAIGADGLIVEVHPNPEIAKCDGAQSLTFDNFARMMEEVHAIREAIAAKVPA
jgi:3-deoxy-7-phosphoheptulonate synthase